MTVTDTLLSYSQGSDYASDPYCAWLGRVMGVPSRPGWSTVGGTAFHKTVEAILLAEHSSLLDEESLDPLVNLERAVEEELKRSHGMYGEADIRASKSGKGVPRDGKGADRAWIEQHLPSWIASWKNWRRSVPWDLALLPDENGEPRPAVEVEFRYGVAKGVDLRGSIDSVWVNRSDHTYRVVDWKAGARVPDSGQQLAVYRGAVLDQYGIDAPYGTFYMAREGVTTEIYDLRKYSPEYLAWYYTVAAERKEAKDFLPSPQHPVFHYCNYEPFCAMCGGERAGEVAQPWEVGPGLRFADINEARRYTRTNLGLPTS